MKESAGRMKKPAIYLICTAHLDPVWQWRWEEGAAEALATFETAAALLERHKDFIFCHNEAWLYRQVERLAPGLFARIKRLVKARRWAVAGGWFLQPDTNLPGVESLARHIAFGRRYFRSRFGKVPRVAYNFDSFGHSGGLPQVLRRSGFRMYIHMRPGAEDLTLPSDLYVWQGVDGSRIFAHRISIGLYHTERDNIEDRLDAGVSRALELGRDVPVFWGLGNHGGGATEKDLALIARRMAKESRVRIVHSTPDEFFRAVAGLERDAPAYSGDLQRAFTGCYTSLSRLKRRARESLGLLLQTESLRAAGWRFGGIAYPEKALEEAWVGHLFNDFHDIITGTCVEPAERDALDLYGFVGEILRRLRLEALAGLCSGTGPRPALPLTVLNANPSMARAPVEAEVMSDYRPFWKGKRRLCLYRGDGSRVPSQEEPARALLPFHDWRRRIVFLDDLPGVGLARYRLEAVPAEKAVRPGREYPKGIRALEFRIDPASGHVTKLRARKGGQVLAGPLLEPLLVEDRADSWGTATGAYRTIAARFRSGGGPVMIASGPVRTVHRTVSVSGGTRVVTDLCVYPGWPVLDFRFRVLAVRPQTRLKLRIPTVFRNGDILAEIPGGALQRPADGQEHVHGRWLFLEGKADGRETGLGIVHSGCPGFDFREGEVRLSVLRTAAYCHERGLDLGRIVEPEFSDLGLHELRVLVTAGSPDKVLASLPGLADHLDQPPFALGHLPAGGGAPGFLEFFRLFPPSIRLLAFKRSDDRRALIVRLQEGIGRRCSARLGFPGTGEAYLMRFRPFEIKTLRFEKGRGPLEADLTEKSFEI